MLLYKESFPLKKGLRFSSYIKKLEEQVLITEHGYELLSHYPIKEILTN